MGVVGAAHNDGLVVHQALDACRERRWGAGGRGDEEGGASDTWVVAPRHSIPKLTPPGRHPNRPPPPLTLLGNPVELDECRLARLVEQPESVDAKTGHEAVRLGDAHIIEKERQLWRWWVAGGRTSVGQSSVNTARA